MAMQKMNGKILAISLIFLMVLPFASTTLTITKAQVQQPSYSVGDWWKYSIEFLSAAEVVMEGTITRTIIEESDDHYIMEVEGSWQPPQPDTIVWTESDTVYLKKSDLSIVEEDGELMRTSGGETTYHLITNVTYSPSFKELDFPIDVDESWWSNVTKTETIQLPPLPPGTSTTEVNRRFTVVRTEEVTVPAGTFDTLVIEHSTPDNIFEGYYSSRANGNVMELVYDRNMNLKQRIELLESNRIVPAGIPLDLTLLLIIGVVAVVIVVALILFIRRRPPAGASTPPPPGPTTKT
ncbi:MAG: hypothetical protein H3Z49_08245 [archaeon]|nr:hypothetical protein [archaeon]